MLPISDGVVTLRAMQDDDAAVLVAGRDAELRRFMGEGSPDPRPTAVIEIADDLDRAVVGWVDVDHDADRTWLELHECNVGYSVFAPHRGRGIAQRAVRLLLELLATEGRYRSATFLIDGENAASLRVATRVGARERWRRVEADGRTNVFLAIAVPSRLSTRDEATPPGVTTGGT